MNRLSTVPTRGQKSAKKTRFAYLMPFGKIRRWRISARWNCADENKPSPISAFEDEGVARRCCVHSGVRHGGGIECDQQFSIMGSSQQKIDTAGFVLGENKIARFGSAQRFNDVAFVKPLICRPVNDN